MSETPLFWLGTHHPEWVGVAGVPLFLSAHRLRLRRLRRALAPWALDSGGFTELDLHGEYRTPAMTYATEARYWSDTLGLMAWCSVQDWMCEPRMLARTGLTVAEHQRRTVHSYRLLRQFAPDLPWVPVLQGWRVEDYLRHYWMYREAGLCLRAAPVVGVGSVCRRQHTGEVVEIFAALGEAVPLRLHGFGLKTLGLRRCAGLLHSADSMAWSLQARRASGPMIEGHRHSKCASCLPWALQWRGRVLSAIAATKAA